MRSARISSATSQANRAILFGLAALGVSVLLVLLFGVELSRAVAHPVRRVSEAAKHVAGGDLSVRLARAGARRRSTTSPLPSTRWPRRSSATKHELEDQNLELRESERLRSELISVISHEVRTPLACVLGYASLLQTRPVDEDTRQEVPLDHRRRVAAAGEARQRPRRCEAHRGRSARPGCAALQPRRARGGAGAHLQGPQRSSHDPVRPGEQSARRPRRPQPDGAGDRQPARKRRSSTRPTAAS